jgi:hypothetical protein
MTTVEWNIGGLVPSLAYDSDVNLDTRQITLKCAALREVIGDDPQTEIDAFNELAVDQATNTQLLNGGSGLQACNGLLIETTNGIDTWVSALSKVNKHISGLDEDRIEYDLIIDIETLPLAGLSIPDTPPVLPTKKYNAPLNNYSNITYYQYSDGTNRSVADEFTGYTIGRLTIHETTPVKQVILYGACLYTPAWISVNGIQTNWVYSLPGIIGGISENLKTIGMEPLTFNLPTPSTTINIQTSTYIMDGDVNTSKGSYLNYIMVVYQ